MSLLAGVRVLDLSTVIAAPFAAGLMADFGADVIKVEQPDGGEIFVGGELQHLPQAEH